MEYIFLNVAAVLRYELPLARPEFVYRAVAYLTAAGDRAIFPGFP